ncbi:hypothetical protein OAF54_03095, partial [bacterium]|nr:hypothetical protein [bacterium]
QVINNQLKVIVNDFVGDDFTYISNSKQFYIDKMIKNLKVKPNHELNRKIDENNKKLLKKAGITVSIMAAIGIVIVYFLWLNSHNQSKFFKAFSMKELIINSVIILLAIAVVEFSIATFIFSRYIAVDTNVIKKEIIQQLQNYAKN